MNLSELKARAKAAQEAEAAYDIDYSYDGPAPTVTWGKVLLTRDAFRAAADPTTILSLIEEIERLGGALAEAKSAAEQNRLLADLRQALITQVEIAAGPIPAGLHVTQRIWDLKKALRPFADAGRVGDLPAYKDSANAGLGGINVGHLRAARSALGEG